MTVSQARARTEQKVLERWVAREAAQWAKNAQGPWRPGLEEPLLLTAESIRDLALEVTVGRARAIAKRFVEVGYAERVPTATLVLWRLTDAGRRAGQTDT